MADRLLGIKCHRMRHREWPVVSLGNIALALLLIGCAGSPASSNASPPAASGPTSVPSGSTTECGAPGYPCTFDAADDQATKRSEALALDVAKLISEGASAAEIESSIDAMEGVVEVQAEPGTVRFRLAGGRPEWVVDDPAIGRGDGLSASPGMAGSAVTQPEVWLAAFHSVAGPTVAAKHALVLSPFLWDFGATDDGAQVAGILANTRGYADGVTSAANVRPGDRTVDVEDFKGWSADQVVHVASHGVRMCKSNPCRALIAVRLLSGKVGGSEVGPRGLELDPSEADETGIDVLHTVDGLSLLALDADFFRYTYPGGLADTLVFFNACETFGAEATDLADAIRGGAGEFLGWSERVASPVALSAALALYPLLAAGRTTGAALDEIGGLAADPAAPHARLTLGPPAAGDLRIRDIVAPLQPPTGQPLAPGATLPIEGTMNDGQPDDVPWQIGVDGLDETEAAAAQLHVSIDDLEAPVAAVSSGSNDAGTRWTVSGRVDLGADLAAPRPATLIVSVDLPEGGISRTEIPVVIGGGERPTGTVWTVHAVREGPGDLGSVQTTLTIDATVEYAGTGPGESLEYRVTDGTYSWTYGPTATGGCIFSAEPVSGNLTADNTSGSQGLAFYVYGSTIRWNAFITFEGDETTRTIECGPDSMFESSQDTIRASGSVLLPVPDPLGRLEGDSDTGSATDANGMIQVSWTIARVR